MLGALLVSESMMEPVLVDVDGMDQKMGENLWMVTGYNGHSNSAIGGNFTYDTGPANFDATHLLAMSFGAELPFGRGKRFVGGAGTLVNGLIGGWQAQSIINYRIGLPFTPTVSRDVANTGDGGQRPNRIGSGELDNPTIDAWLDKAAFEVPANFTFGNSGRGILRGDDQWNVDFSIFKKFKLAEGKQLQLRAEF